MKAGWCSKGRLSIFGKSRRTISFPNSTTRSVYSSWHEIALRVSNSFSDFVFWDRANDDRLKKIYRIVRSRRNRDANSERSRHSRSTSTRHGRHDHSLGGIAERTDRRLPGIHRHDCRRDFEVIAVVKRPPNRKRAEHDRYRHDGAARL